MNVKFYNHDSKKELFLNVDKSLIMIYGKNGNGKTTFSRSNDFDSKYVFNEDFICSNVYNVTENGANQTSKTKENFSGLWIGENIVKIRKEITLIIADNKKNTELFDNTMEPLKRYFENNGIPFNYNDKLNNLIDKDFKFELGKTEQLISEYKSPFIFDTTIKNNEEFKSNVVFVKKNDIYNMLITTIKPNELLSELVLGNKNDKLKFINDEIKKLDDNVELIKKVEKIYTEKDVTPSLAKTIEEWYKIHLNRNTCVFCGNQNISNALSEWKIVIEDMYSKMKKTLISYIEDTIKICSTIISNDAFRKADSELVDFIDYIDKKLINELNNINENKFQKIIIDKTINKRDIIEINGSFLYNNKNAYLILQLLYL